MARASKGEQWEKSKSPFATTLRLLMDKQPITTQAQLAEITGKTRQTISQYVNGVSEPGYDTLVKIADHFDVSLDYLLGRSDVASIDLSVQDIHRETGLTAENIAFLMERGPFGQLENPFFAESYKKLINDLISYASTHQASRSYCRFLQNANSPETPMPQPDADCDHSIVQYNVVAEIISGIPEDGVDYTKGIRAISSSEYARFLLDDFLSDLKVYLRNLYFESDIGGMDNGND